MSNHQKALELLKYIDSHDQEVKDLISTLSLNNYGIRCTKTKLEMEIITGVELDGNIDHFRVMYSPVDIYLTHYDITVHSPTNIKLKEPEWLLHFRFSCGAYELHSEYPEETFKQMIDELVEVLKPKYFDALNKQFYFEPEKALFVKEQLPIIFKKYKDLVQKELDKKRIAALKAELDKLEGDK